MRRRKFKHTFSDGSTWTIEVTKRGLENDDLGWCHEGRRRIVIHPKQRGTELLDTIIHELTHRAFPRMGEARVAQFANDVTEVLERFGYRRSKR